MKTLQLTWRDGQKGNPNLLKWGHAAKSRWLRRQHFQSAHQGNAYLNTDTPPA